jgi:hypothetical protein
MELVSGTISTRITNMTSRINQLTAGWGASILISGTIRHWDLSYSSKATTTPVAFLVS